MALPDLITLDEFLAALDKLPGDVEQQEADKYDQAVAAASATIRSYSGRKFEIASTPSTRIFEYDGSGYLEIDDATNITNIKATWGSTDRVLLTSEWSAQPYGEPVYEWLRLAPNAWGIGSPEMGFTRNLDTLWDQYPLRPTLFEVTATYGWPEIPADVKQAALWTAIALAENPRPFVSESIEGYSRTFGGVPMDAIPMRAVAILTPYVKVKV